MRPPLAGVFRSLRGFNYRVWAAGAFVSNIGTWVQRTADEAGWPHAIVGYANLMTEDVRPTLDRLARYPLMRGIRMQLHWHENEQYRFAVRPNLSDAPLFRRNFAALADYEADFLVESFGLYEHGSDGVWRKHSDFPLAVPVATTVLRPARRWESASA